MDARPHLIPQIPTFLALCEDSIFIKVSLHQGLSADSSGRMRLHSDRSMDICLLVPFHFRAKLTSVMLCKAAAATATKQPEGQPFLHHSVTGNSKVIRSQSVNCKLMPTGSDWPAADPVFFPPHDSLLSPGSQRHPDVQTDTHAHKHTVKELTLEHPSALKTHNTKSHL